MIKIIRAQFIQQKVLRLYFSDNSWGDYDLQTVCDRQTELVIPLNDEQYFKTFFLELGALCWRNGLELSPNNKKSLNNALICTVYCNSKK